MDCHTFSASLLRSYFSVCRWAVPLCFGYLLWRLSLLGPELPLVAMDRRRDGGAKEQLLRPTEGLRIFPLDAERRSQQARGQEDDLANQRQRSVNGNSEDAKR